MVDENPASHSDPRPTVDIEIKDDTNGKAASISGGELLILFNKLNDNEYVVQLPLSEPMDEGSATLLLSTRVRRTFKSLMWRK